MERQKRDCAHKLSGTVVRVRRGRYVVRVPNAPPECEACKACSLLKKKDIVIPARSQFPCRVGDEVELLAPKSRPVLALILLFIVPLATLMAGFMVAVLNELPEQYGLLCALSGLMIGFLAVLTVDRLVLSDKYRYKIVQITKNLSEENKNG